MAGNEIEAEKWIDKWLIETGARVKIVGNFGQTVDVWSGTKKVPSKIFRNHGLGWMMRLMIEKPERRTRYGKVLVAFGNMMLLDLINALQKQTDMTK